jgi:hypothetical protein
MAKKNLKKAMKNVEICQMYGKSNICVCDKSKVLPKMSIFKDESTNMESGNTNET